MTLTPAAASTAHTLRECRIQASLLLQDLRSDDAGRRPRAGDFLFPYRDQYFVCEAGLVERVGFQPDHPDWERIGYDWVRPCDPEAHARLALLCAETGYAA